MHILFYGAKNYDVDYFDTLLPDYPEIKIKYISANLAEETARLAEGYDAICAFVNADIGSKVLERLNQCGIKLILMRCAGYNNVDINKAKELGITVMRVPSYSPEAVAEHAMALALTANRKTHKAYAKMKENDFSLSGLMGRNLYQKTAGIIGTGKIGAAMARICNGFGMRVLVYDVYKNPDIQNFAQYVSLDELFSQSDLISLHCPLVDETYHLINKESIEKMKDHVILVNTSRGGLIDTKDLIEAIKDNKFAAVGLDVYAEENGLVFEDHSEDILQTTIVARLLSFPNVMITSHQGFFTKEAMEAISYTTLENAMAYLKGDQLENQVQ
jgi:Lactate dehydrogenase and related dehydrogenases